MSATGTTGFTLLQTWVYFANVRSRCLLGPMKASSIQRQRRCRTYRKAAATAPSTLLLTLFEEKTSLRNPNSSPLEACPGVSVFLTLDRCAAGNLLKT